MQSDLTTAPRKRGPKPLPRVERACAVCQTTFLVKRDRLKHRPVRFCSHQCQGISEQGDLSARFLANIRTDDNGCWLWTATIDSGGYGQMRVGGPIQKAHQVAWTLATGAPVPEDHMVLHTCDVRACVRNDERGVYVVRGREYPRYGHLFLGDQTANMQDMADKGRAILPDQRGGKHAGARLTETQVREIRERFQSGIMLYQDLAAEYNVSSQSIGKVIRRERWRHLS